MILVLTSLLLFALAAVCNAIMDKLQFHYQQSVFFRLNYDFWDPLYSSESARILPFTKYKLDAWHLFKSLMIIFMAAACVVLYQADVTPKAWHYPGMMVVYGCVWNGTFNLFFNHLLKRRK